MRTKFFAVFVGCGQATISQYPSCPNGFEIELQRGGDVRRFEIYASWKAIAFAKKLVTSPRFLAERDRERAEFEARLRRLSHEIKSLRRRSA